MRPMSVRVVAGCDAVAHHHVVDVGGVEPDAFAQRVEHLGEDLLWMEVRQAHPCPACPCLAASAPRR